MIGRRIAARRAAASWCTLLLIVAGFNSAARADFPPPGAHSKAPKYWPSALRWATNYTPHGYGGIVGLVPDGRGGVWFAQRQTVEHIDVFGVMHSFRVPYNLWEIDSLARDPHGRLWFSLGQSGRIGTIGVDNKIHTLVLVPRRDFPDITEIAFDARGHLWFIDQGRSSFGLRTPTGAVIERRRFNFDTNQPSHLSLCGGTMYFSVDIIPNTSGGGGDARYGLSGLYALTSPNLRESFIGKFSIFAQTDSTVLICDRSNRLWYALSNNGPGAVPLRDVGYIDVRQHFHDMSFSFDVDAAGADPNGSVWLCGFGAHGSRPMTLLPRLRCEQYRGHERLTSIVMPINAFVSQSVGIDAAETLWFGLSWPHTVLRVSNQH